jgi:DNA-binding protein HU-beta
MSRAFLADVIKESAEISGVKAKVVVNDVLDAITDQIKSSGSFNVPGFGTFRLVETKARKGLNPRTGEAVAIKAGKTVRFKASGTLKEAMKGRARAIRA